MEINFVNPEYLWLLFSLPILVFIHFTTLKSTKRRAFKFANFEAIERITGGELLSKNLFLLVTRVCILLLFILAISGVSFTYQGLGSNYDFVIVIDNSNSMIVDDFTPSRLQAAKTAAINFLDQIRPDNKVGIVAFSSTAYSQSELTDDKFKVGQVIRNIELSSTGGTDIGEALVTGANLLMGSENAKAIILITDGQSNVGLPVADAIEYINLRQVTVYTIGIGTEEGADFYGAQLVLDETTLKNIALSTSGEYYRAEDEVQLQDAYSRIANSMERKITQRLDLWFTIIALFLLIFEWTLINTKYRTIP